jgi:very-short-patch-repair endonuclease
MNIHVNNLNTLLEARRYLRNNPTPEENVLWQKLKNKRLGNKFRRQHSIGNFIADFYCPAKKLIIEIDGGQHLNKKESDNERSNYLESLGFKVVRFWNKEINSEIDTVIKKIEGELK